MKRAGWDQNFACACVLWAIYILNGCVLGGLMKQAQNSDSKTHMKKLNLAYRTEIRHKSLKYLFLETPCISPIKKKNLN